MPQARLRTERLDLVPLTEEHLPFLVDLNSDPEVVRYLYTRALTAEETEKRARGWIREAEATPEQGKWIGFADGEPVALFMLEPPSHPTDDDAAELGYRLPRRHWRKGFAKEGSLELLRHAFEDLGLSRVIAQTMAVNEGSRATMTSVGMSFVRAFQEEFEEPLAGHAEGEVEYEITRETWLGRRAG
ncbi:RimJ/RimL family protein N-acetyltransferase [Nocardioides luteus]|uniref:GNAT family acetyltransferase n=1 Tax=Nocardioides luteus TaxID=1844 RepID=A0ABQ5T3E8_9ACTN|nr:GNAT family N-acetyltransferase [Nocardioides luteus]MDR7311613.1 RimJ/RimL family protein N-acetyltransferase [Nocardioides luteus]GGR54404.1 GNAT family acetyltransferase [Nocardioides luteus]GLJ70262.1 GNAT family acetyltransferase [Nocardioides luteus]